MSSEFTFRMPDLGEGTSGGRIVRVLVAEGGSVQLDDPIIEVETEKSRIVLPSPATGTVRSLFAVEGRDARVGEPLAVFTGIGELTFRTTHDGTADPKEFEDGQQSPPSPGAVKLAEKHGVNLVDVTGTGPGGAIQAADIIRHVRDR